MAIGGVRPSYPTPSTLGRHDPIDVDAEERRAQAMLGLALFLGFAVLVSAWYAWEELRYMLRGAAAEAQVIRTYQVEGRRGRWRYVEFRYRDKAGNEQDENCAIPDEWQEPPSGKLQVQYIPAETRSARLAGTHNYLPVGFLGICLIAVTAVCAWLWRDARAGVRDLARMDREEEAENRNGQ